MNMVKDFTEYEYLNINDYHDTEKQILFSNLKMPLLLPDLEERFFRENTQDFGWPQEEEILKHKHEKI